jgi:hypothetical protein
MSPVTSKSRLEVHNRRIGAFVEQQQFPAEIRKSGAEVDVERQTPKLRHAL